MVIGHFIIFFFVWP